jgi:hypothetical protein
MWNGRGFFLSAIVATARLEVLVLILIPPRLKGIADTL